MRKLCSSRNQERIESDDLLRKLMELLLAYRGMIRVTILKNIALVTYAVVTLYHGTRGGNGWLSKAALARCLPLGTGPREREQRLYRFLGNIRWTPELLIPLHVVLACGTKLRGRLPMIFDQTTLRGIRCSVVYLGARVLFSGASHRLSPSNFLLNDETFSSKQNASPL